jgi:ribosomal protein S18 acetylase RimI-like enzyme
MTPVSLRTASTEDVESLIAFWAIAGENDSRPPDSAHATRQLLMRDPEAVIVAERDHVLVGTVIAGWDGWRAHLYRLAVHPDHRQQGIAHLLLEAAEQHLLSLGATRFDAMVLEGNELGASAWRARGYRPQPEWRRWVRPASHPTNTSL